MNQDVPEIIKVPGSSKISCFLKLVTRNSPGFSEADLLHSFSGHFQWHVSFFLHASKGRVFWMSPRSQSKDFGHFFGNICAKKHLFGTYC